ncbi:MAG: toluene tolerance protein [Candidatus Pelagadaptatus aseana]|uniref:lipopolysaccharide kinase InaA family protein n=1 Tax=Candidatus Pelagadaptatus aseana TaxID=3120508 RepID=UPI0039B220E8
MKSITRIELEKLIAAGDILEKDGYGVKVVRLNDDRYLKIFNRRPGISMAKIFPRSKQFARNARNLKKRRITTVGIVEVFKISDAESDCVIYHGIPGNTLRDVFKTKPKDPELSKQAGAYISQLHDAGVMFRSLHFGNIIVLADGSFGLIDIADMRVNVFPLNRWQRKRNFQHVFRYQPDIDTVNMPAFIEGYEAYSSSAQGLSKTISSIEPEKQR